MAKKDDNGSNNQLVYEEVINPEGNSQQGGTIASRRFKRSIFSCTSSHNKRFRSLGESGIIFRKSIIKICLDKINILKYKILAFNAAMHTFKEL